MASAWRVVKAAYAARWLDGEGARRTGGRWNRPGDPVIYLSDSLASALLEILVHFDPAMPMGDYVYGQVELPDEAVFALPKNGLPPEWPGRASQARTQALGQELLVEDGRFVLAVPSAIVPGARNYVVNATHDDFDLWAMRQEKTKPQALPLDPRLFGQVAPPARGAPRN
jgi:RES domain-containing protein